MSNTDHKSRTPRTPRAHTPRRWTSTRASAARFVWALARLSLGWIFLWAFLDKLFGLGHQTTSRQAWVNGGRPTYGFLKHATKGPFKGFYGGIAGAGWADWLFMLALAGLGIALILGIACGSPRWPGPSCAS